MSDKLDAILKNVQKPTRYSGGEWNSIVKNPADYQTHFAFAFPDLYEVGMSHLGLKILYHIINSRPDSYCERAFSPAPDMESQMLAHQIPLLSIETRTPLNQFDIIGFTLQYELSYTTVLNMLKLADIPLLSKERTASHPLICAGGPCCYNPEPMADFIDFFIIGDGEDVIHEILDAYKETPDRQELLKQLSLIDGIYVPSLLQKTIHKRNVANLNDAPFPSDLIVPYMETVHDRITLELFRGCTRGCRFCQAGFTSRPIRERSLETLVKTAEESISSTGYEEISLCSLSTSDYSQLEPLCDSLLSLTQSRNMNLAVPSLRLDNFSMELMQKIQKVRKSGLTFAPEAGSQRLRDVINKNITEDDLLNAAKTAFAGGYRGMKLYFMLGLPTETDDDVLAIAELAQKVAEEYYATLKHLRHKQLKITVSTSTFIPKPHTPFQWAEQISIEETHRRQNLLKDALKKKHFQYNWHSPETSLLEGVFSRGDRRLSKVLLTAHEKGCKLDGWSEHFKYDKWLEAFAENGINPSSVIAGFDPQSKLPWSHIHPGVSLEFLKRELQNSLQTKTTPQCRESCSACGIQNCPLPRQE